ncbi:Protein CBG27149 [Caenorhabditis briggsae]|uniref:Protein CBG27149 n=1 Tax=Caenorhabditis briggsae TaxID=6238 RepID=B6IL59_CAEBR|nr:Protein CBG27149 [Caenorhabditis briggsae]CAS00612.1 Protein CBG27149 [Caenorhabditis briggsae]
MKNECISNSKVNEMNVGNRDRVEERNEEVKSTTNDYI